MKRGKRLVVLCHCLLNANARTLGLADHSGAHAWVAQLVQAGIAIYQLPCPESTYYGGRRWSLSREQLAHPGFLRHCERLAGSAIRDLIDYSNNGVVVGPCVGVEGSPSCGVHTSGSAPAWGGDFGRRVSELDLDAVRRMEGRGLFLEAFLEASREAGLALELVAQDESAPHAQPPWLVHLMG